MNPAVRPLLAFVLLATALWSVQDSGANFGGSAGFSGRGGPTCTACHQPPHPTDDTAQAVLEGLPAAWHPGKEYALVVRVTGGPTPLPDPAPQGGFDLAVSSGTLHATDPADAPLFRFPSTSEATYTAEGTHRREWHLSWTAPELATRPGPVHLWLAVLAANGNHVIAANLGDGGETLDAAASIIATVAPDAAALDAWRALPLDPPTARATSTAQGWTVDGEHRDANATALLFRVDDGAWQMRDTSREWRVIIQGPAERLEFRSEGEERKSPTQQLALADEDGPAFDAASGTPAEAPATAAAATALVLALAAIRRHP